MNCFTHIETPAHAICKHCAKAVCLECAIDTKEGIACSEKCASEIKSYNLMMNKSKELYGIGKDGKKMPLPIIIYATFAIVIFVGAIYRSYSYHYIDLVGFMLGIMFFGIAILAYLRNKKLGINF